MESKQTILNYNSTSPGRVCAQLTFICQCLESIYKDIINGLSFFYVNLKVTLIIQLSVIILYISFRQMYKNVFEYFAKMRNTHNNTRKHTSTTNSQKTTPKITNTKREKTKQNNNKKHNKTRRKKDNNPNKTKSTQNQTQRNQATPQH